MGACLKTMTAYPGIWSIQDYQKDFHPSKKVNADPSEFGAWLQDQPVETQNILVPCKSDKRWGKVVRIFYKEVYYNKDHKKVNVEDPEGSKEVFIKKQKFVISLDPKSPFAGNIYNDDDKILVYTKFVASLVFRPVHTVAYTLYNATLIHAAVIIFKGIAKDKPASETLQKVVCSLVDIVRVPVYEVAIMIVTIVGILTAPFHPELVYDFRAVIGRLNRELGWGKKEGGHDYMPCMQPKINIMQYTLNDQPVYPQRKYENEANPVLVGLDNRRGYFQS